MRTMLRRLNSKSCFLTGLLLLLLIVLGIRQTFIRWNDPPYGGPRWRHDQEARVLDAVFRYQIAENRHNDQICFLSVRETPPDRAVMQSFSALPYVVPISPRFQSASGDFVDRTTGRPALHFWADRIDWDSDVEVRVSGGGAAANRSGDAGEFTALWYRGEWKVSYEPTATF